MIFLFNLFLMLFSLMWYRTIVNRSVKHQIPFFLATDLGFKLLERMLMIEITIIVILLRVLRFDGSFFFNQTV